MAFVTPGRPRKQPAELRGKNEARAELMKKARFSEFVSCSLQPCQLRDNERTLQALFNDKIENDDQKKQKLLGLIAVLQNLQSEYIAENGKDYECSFVSFDEAIELYFSYQNKFPPFTKADKNHFIYALLNEKWGLCVYLLFVEQLNCRYIVLRPDNCSLEVFLHMMCSTRNVESAENTWLDADKVRGIVQTVDTEWDRKVVRVLLAANRSRREMGNLGIDPDNITSDTAKVCIP